MDGADFVQGNLPLFVNGAYVLPLLFGHSRRMMNHEHVHPTNSSLSISPQESRTLDAPDASERETVLLLKHLSTLQHVKEARSLLYDLCADHDRSPDVAATLTMNLDLLADEINSLWRRHQKSREFLLSAHARARGLFLRFAHSVTNPRYDYRRCPLVSDKLTRPVLSVPWQLRNIARL